MGTGWVVEREYRMGVVLQGISGFPSLGSPLTLRGRWPLFPMVIHFLPPKNTFHSPDHYMYTKQKPVAMEIAVDLGGMGRMNLGPVAGVEVSEDASLTLGGESSAKWGWYLTPRVEPIEGIDSSMEKEVITRTLANGKREWPWGATKRSTMCTKAWKETVKRVKTTLKGGLLSVVLINADDGCDYY